MNFINLFAGASGMSEGFIKSGFSPVAHIEMDSDACFTVRTRTAYHYLKSQSKLYVYYDYLKGSLTRERLYAEIPKGLLGSVLNVEISDKSIQSIFSHIQDEIKTQKLEEIDLIIGGPPCQTFSLAKRHQNGIEKDPRNYLYIQYGRFLKRFKPKAFVFENVPGILSSNDGQHFKNIKKYYRKLGYEVHSQILDAADYGVLQTRRRVIILGWRRDIDLGFPELEKIKVDCTVNELFADLTHLEPGQTVMRAKYGSSTTDYLTLFELRNGIGFVTHNIARPHNKRDLEIYKIAIQKWNDEGIRLKYTDLPVRLRTHKNTNSFLDRFKVVNGKGISHTIVAHISKDGHYYINPDGNQCRSISVREAARLQSFSDDFYFEGSRTSNLRQIGNAVPPLLSYAIARKLKDLLCKTK